MANIATDKKKDEKTDEKKDETCATNVTEQEIDESIRKLRTIDPALLPHILLKLMSDKSTEWGNNCPCDLVVKSQDEYVLLQKYTNSNPVQDKMLKEITKKIQKQEQKNKKDEKKKEVEKKKEIDAKKEGKNARNLNFLHKK